MEEFGEISWCAAEKKCKNTLKAATRDITCSKCGNNVHNDCCETVEKHYTIHIYCFTCLDTRHTATKEQQNGNEETDLKSNTVNYIKNASPVKRRVYYSTPQQPK
jgi:hypothetical protein